MKVLTIISILLCFIYLSYVIKSVMINYIRDLSKYWLISCIFYMCFSLGCLILAFSSYNLSFLQEYSIVLRIGFIMIAFKLTYIELIIKNIKDPNNEDRQYTLSQIQNLDKMNQKMKEEKAYIKSIKKTRKEFLKDFKHEIKNLKQNSNHYTDEEFEQEYQKIINKYKKGE